MGLDKKTEDVIYINALMAQWYSSCLVSNHYFRSNRNEGTICVHSLVVKHRTFNAGPKVQVLLDAPKKRKINMDMDMKKKLDYEIVQRNNGFFVICLIDYGIHGYGLTEELAYQDAITKLEQVEQQIMCEYWELFEQFGAK